MLREAKDGGGGGGGITLLWCRTGGGNTGRDGEGIVFGIGLMDQGNVGRHGETGRESGIFKV